MKVLEDLLVRLVNVDRSDFIFKVLFLQGEQLFNDLVFAGKEKGIKIKVVQSASEKPVTDTEYLAKEGNYGHAPIPL